MFAVAKNTHSGCTGIDLRSFPPAISTGSVLLESRQGNSMFRQLAGALDSSSSRITPGF